MPRLPTPIALLALALCVTGVRADQAAMPNFSFSGFGTFGLARSSEKQADFTSTLAKPDGTGFSHRWSADIDSLLAAQFTAQLTPQLTAVLQVISEQNYANSYEPRAEWANLKYAFSPDFSIRLGRTALPIFMLSDTRKVGYANPSVRPPIDVYSLVPVSRKDGVDAVYRMALAAPQPIQSS